VKAANDYEGDEKEADSYEKWLFRQHVYEFQAFPARLRKAYLAGCISLAELVALWEPADGQ